MLRRYTEALIEPVYEHFKEGLLKQEEVCLVLSSAALLMHMKVNNIKQLPAKEIAESVMDEEG